MGNLSLTNRQAKMETFDGTSLFQDRATTSTRQKYQPAIQH
jgi:hypothetical protein